MILTENNKLYTNVIILIAFTILIVIKIYSGFQNKDFDYLDIAINSGLILLVIRNIIKLIKPQESKNNI